MQASMRLGRAAALVTATALAAPVFAGGEAGQLTLRDAGARFVGYTTETQDNGTVNVLNPMFVQYFLPAQPRHELPVVMIHGGGGQGTDWLETPDGRDGWVDYFVADGWDVYVVDRPGHGRSQSNADCGNGQVGAANSGIISRLSTADPKVWPGGEPTPTNETVVGWTASSATAPYCGDPVAARAISALLEEIGPAILLAHSAGGGSTFRVPELVPDKVAGILAFEAAGANPVESGRGNSSPLIVGWTAEPPLTDDFRAVSRDGCSMQGDDPSRLVNYADLPIVLLGTEMGLASEAQLKCQAAVWSQAGADASYVWFPDRGLLGGGHFAMAQLDSADYAEVFMELAAEIDAKHARSATTVALSPLPSTDDYSAFGPFATTSEQNTGPDGTYTIVRPATLGADGFLHAPIIFGPGIGGQVQSMMGLLERIASHGFVIIGRQLNGGPGDAENNRRMIAGLDWLIEQNTVAGSVFEGMLDVERAASMGYSVGGTAAVDIGGHEAISTVVSIHGHGADGELHGTLLLLGGTNDVMRDGRSWLAPTYDAAEVPTLFSLVEGANHGYIGRTLDGVPGGVETPAMIAWLRYWLYNDQQAHSYFFGDDCVMCSSPWTNTQRKNWPEDAGAE